MAAPVELFADGGVTFATLSYGLAAVVFLCAFLVALRKRLSTQDSAALLPALLGSATWGALQAWDARVEFLGAVGHYFVDVLRFAGWLAFVALALPRRSPDRWLRFLPWAAGAACGLGAVAGLAFQVSGDLGGGLAWPDWLPVVFGLLASMLGLVLVEQAARNLQASQYWARKHVLIAVGLMMAYDLVTFSAGYVLMQVPPELREARGAAHALTGLVLLFGIRRLGRAQVQRGGGGATFFTNHAGRGRRLPDDGGRHGLLCPRAGRHLGRRAAGAVDGLRPLRDGRAGVLRRGAGPVPRLGGQELLGAELRLPRGVAAVRADARGRCREA